MENHKTETAAEEVTRLCLLSKTAAVGLASSASEKRNEALRQFARLLQEEDTKKALAAANEKDLAAAKEHGMREAMLDRLALTPARIDGIAASLQKLIALPDALGEGVCFERPNGLKIRRVSVPLGIIGIIYEARPNVTADAAAICIKTGNCAVLRGGKEAFHTNCKMEEVIRQALSLSGFDPNAVQLVKNTSRASAEVMMAASGYLDVLIPRGGKSLIRTVVENARVPVLETGAGNCHLYVEKTAEPEMALKVCMNAKLSRPSVCNAAETLLVDREAAAKFLPMFYKATRQHDLLIRGCKETLAILSGCSGVEPATEEDYETEYNDYIISVKVVNSAEEAVAHINRYSTGHSEAILTQNIAAAEYFKKYVDSAAVYINASTRFTDGEEFGFGAEIGISTQKLHARGPMGPQQLTSYKYIIEGNGQVR